MQKPKITKQEVMEFISNFLDNAGEEYFEGIFIVGHTEDKTGSAAMGHVYPYAVEDELKKVARRADRVCTIDKDGNITSTIIPDELSDISNMFKDDRILES